jgi:hypothetical protein
MAKPILILLVLFTGFSFTGCTRTFTAESPILKTFPTVQAAALTGEKIEIPTFFNEGDLLLLVGFIQDSQFDIDRWILGLKQLKTPVEVAEIPTIQGFFPRIISSRINQGMKDGIPEEDWKLVFTVYKGAEKIAEFLGNTKPRNARIVLVDKSGIVQWFHDRGYSADKALELDVLVRKRRGKE